MKSMEGDMRCDFLSRLKLFIQAKDWRPRCSPQTIAASFVVMVRQKGETGFLAQHGSRRKRFLPLSKPLARLFSER